MTFKGNQIEGTHRLNAESISWSLVGDLRDVPAFTGTVTEMAPDAGPQSDGHARTPCVHGRGRTVRCRMCEREGR